RAQRLVVVRRLSQAQVAERRGPLERAHARVRADVDALPRRVPELERVPQPRIERPEQELEQALVARAGLRELDADWSEPIAERTHLLAERADEVEPAEMGDRPAHLDREAEAGRRLLGPAHELRLRRQPVERREQLDGRQALGVETEE